MKRVMATRKKVIKNIILQTVKLIVALLILNWLLQSGLAAQFLDLDIDLSPLLPSITILSLILYISSLIQTIFVMRIAEIIGYALNGLAVALALYLFNLTPLVPEPLPSINFWLFIFMLIIILNYVAKSLADLYHEPIIGVFSTSVLLFFTGLSLTNILTILMSRLTLSPNISDIIPGLIFWSFTATAIIFPASSFRCSPNPYLHYFGEKVGSHVTSIIFLLILIQIYFAIVRPNLISQSNLLLPIELVEWGVICLSFWLFYRNLKKQVGKHLTEPLKLGDWTMLKQEIEYYTDLEQLNIASLVKEFIEYGVKDGIITQLTSVMLLSGFKETHIRYIIKKILDFHDIPYPKICFRSWLKGIDEENKRRREELIREILNDMKNYWKMTGIKYYRKTEVGLSEKEQAAINGG